MMTWRNCLSAPTLFLMAIVSSYAQDAAAVSLEVYSVLFENDDIRVLEMTYQPGQGDTIHSHPKYVGLVMEGGTLRVHHENGESEDATFETGETVPLALVTHHRAENIGKKIFRAILIENKHQTGVE